MIFTNSTRVWVLLKKKDSMAVLKIYNQIVAEEEKMDLWWFRGVDGICFKDIDEFVAGIPEDDDTIELKLHCLGGSTTEGWAIYDKLRATGKKITSTIEGNCASMATIIHLAASERKGQKHAQLCIHEPYYPEYTLADAYRAEDLQKMANDLNAETEKFLDLYVERTGANREELAALMKEDKYVDMDRAKALGFISEIIEPMSASKNNSKAKAWNNNINNQKKGLMDQTKKKTVAEALRMLSVALGITTEKAVAMDLNTESGDTLTVEREDGDPQVGDTASPDGDFVMPDGKTIKVEGGVITEIVDPADGGGDASALETANARIAELEAENTSLRAQAKTSAEKEILNAVAIAGGKEWLQTVASKRASSSRSPEQIKPAEGTVVVAKKSKVSEKLEALKAKQEKE